MDHNEWCIRYRRMQAIADRVAASRIRRARRLCKAAGLDPSLLGIHPHNAMCSLEAGKPWPGVNYSKVRACMRLLNMPSPSQIVHRWDVRVRIGGR